VFDPKRQWCLNPRHCGGGCHWTEPELIPQWDALGHLVEAITEPGGHAYLAPDRPNGAAPAISETRTCGCDACQALYAGLVNL
jgi:hypothetical protein